MAEARKRGEEIRRFILENVPDHPTDVVRLAAEKFGITRQAINKHIKVLVGQKALEVSGTTKDRVYRLLPEVEKSFLYYINDELQEDVVWREDILPLLKDLPENVLAIWNYCFTEMFNNALDHSNGSIITVGVEKTRVDTKINILDNGEGIFKKIQRELGLMDQSHAVLELSKGKVTTDPVNHTGEGIFFTSRAMEGFKILSGDTAFLHKKDSYEDTILSAKRQKGTAVLLNTRNDTETTIQGIFDMYANPDDENYGFNKTEIMVDLVRYGDEMLVSRSQAKRLMTRVERFKTVILDFSGVAAIGQAFADEIFRVFANKHPAIRLVPINMTEPVQKMVLRAL